MIKNLDSMVAIAAGSNFSLLVDCKGRLLTFGSNDHGQLGRGDNEDSNIPKLVQSLVLNDTIIAVVGGFNHSLIMDNQKQLFTCGWNMVGQLGHGHKKDIVVPTKVNGLPLLKLPHLQWSLNTHHLFPKVFRDKVFTVLLVRKLMEKGYSNIKGLKIPKVLILFILQISCNNHGPF